MQLTVNVQHVCDALIAITTQHLLVYRVCLKVVIGFFA